MTSVIVIDDYDDAAEVLCEYLEMNNIKVLARGNNGREAVELYKKYKPDLVLMDLVMPKFDGYHGLQKIREFDPKAKIIMITGSLSQHTEKTLKGLQASATIVKPYETNHVIDTIKKVKNGYLMSSSR
jgi:DNA-binding response OmpR family regulator